jgi:TetR/AcrR family acrAB operon transcriptional repressor
MGATKEQAEQTRKLLLNSALKVFSENGFAASRLEDIAKDAGVTRGAIYWHFKNKLDIFQALFQEVMESIFKDLGKIGQFDISGVDKLRIIAIQIGRKLLTDANYRAVGFLFYGIEWTKEVQSVVEQTMISVKELEGQPLIKIIKEGQEKGEIKDALSPEIIAKSLRAFYHGMANMIFDHYENIQLDDIEPMVDSFIQGIEK